MSKPIIYGVDRCAAVRTVLIVANAIGLDYEFKEVDTDSGDHKKEEYLKKNPQHTIPVLEDGDKVIWDSHAIATYLIGKYAKNDSLYPNDLFVRAQIDQRLHFDSGVLFARSIKVLRLFIQNKEVPQEDKDSVIEAFDFLEKFLGSNDYLVGNSVTVADLCIAATISSTNLLVPLDAAKFPKLSAWEKRVSALPYYKKVNGPGLANLTAFLKMKLALY